MIINPLWVYILGIVGGLKVFVIFFGVALIVMSLSYLLAELRWHKNIAWIWGIGLFFILLSILIPSKETIVTMWLAKNITVDRLHLLYQKSIELTKFITENIR